MASSEALDVVYWAMHSVLYRHIRIATEIASDGGTFVRHHRLFCLIILAKRPYYGLYKLKKSLNINLICVISLFVRFLPLPTTMDAVSATIVDGGRAICQNLG